MIAVLESKRAAIAALCASHGVARLDVFGSALGGDFRGAESDVDLLVEFVPMDPHALVDAYFGLLEGLRAILCVKIDLVMIDAIKNRFVAADIEQTKQVFYAA